MEIDEALTIYLLAQPGLIALIGTNLYPDETPQRVDLRTTSTVTYQNIDNILVHSLAGQDSLESPNWQYTVYSPTRAEARAIANQIKAALCDYQGTLSGLIIQYIKLVNEFPHKMTSTDGLVKANVVDLEFEINYIRE